MRVNTEAAQRFIRGHLGMQINNESNFVENTFIPEQEIAVEKEPL